MLIYKNGTKKKKSPAPKKDVGYESNSWVLYLKKPDMFFKESKIRSNSKPMD